MKLRKLLSLFLAVAMMACIAIPAFAAEAKTDNTPRNINFNYDWTYRRTGPDNPTLPEKVTLPHDAMIHDKRDAKSPTGSAGAWYVPGTYQYDKTFEVPKEWNTKHVVVHFGGVYKNAKVYVNGQLAGERPYGYSPFSINMDPYLKYGKKNKIRVIADNSQAPNSRWYSGSGIYRPVSMIVTNKQYIAENGIKVTTESYSPAVIRVRTQTVNANGYTPNVEIYYGKNKVASAKGNDVKITVPNAKLWDAEHPNLYTAKVSLNKGGKTADQDTAAFGIRKLDWSKNGFFVNGKSTLLRGAAIHSDNGILGAVSTQEAEDRKVQILKENGYNAIRSSHNTASDELLTACDKYGMYVLDEFADMWYTAKNKYDYSVDFEKWHTQDLHAMVEKDYDHPSVIMYSIGNEVTEPAKDQGVQTAREMVTQLHNEDPSRPVTCGINLLVLLNAKLTGSATTSASSASDSSSTDALKSLSGSTLYNTAISAIGPGMNMASALTIADQTATPVFDELDIAGYNYGNGRYDRDVRQHPNRIMVGTETFPSTIYSNWAKVEKYPQLIGDFMWTGIDYLGEAGIGSWNYEGTSMISVNYPWKLAEAGAIDLCGHATGEAAYEATVWHLRDKPYIGVQPCNHPGEKLSKAAWRSTNAIDSWSWAGCNGNDVTVEVYSDKGDYVVLYLNGQKIGQQDLNEYKCSFNTKYQPGTLVAKVYNSNGTEVAENQLTSATGNIHLNVAPEVKSAKPGQVVFVDVSLLGQNGVVDSNSDRKVTFKADGGELLGFGSAKPSTEEEFVTGSYTTYYGRALAAVRVDQNAKSVKFTVKDTTTGQKVVVEIPVK